MYFYSFLGILMWSLVAFSVGVVAQGGKEQVKNPIFEDGCVATIPPGFDLESCEEVPAPDQAGVEVFFCDQVLTVMCPAEDEQ